MKHLYSLLISLLILAVIYWKIGLGAFLGVFLGCDVLWLVLSLGLVVPVTLVAAWRFQQLMPPGVRVSFGEANGLILAASSLNMVLPSKLGDIAKSYFMKERGLMSGNMALSLVVFEKACGMLALLLWCVFGLALYPNKSGVFWMFTGGVATTLIAGLVFVGSRRFQRWTAVLVQEVAPAKFRPKLCSLWDSFSQIQTFFWSNKTHALIVAAMSLFLWFLNLVQIWLFILALKAWTPFFASLAIAPLAIFAGLVPLTFAGIGTRDAAVIMLYKPFLDPSVAAALGWLYTSRYLLPAIGGLPFLRRYLVEPRWGLRATPTSRVIQGT